MMPLDERLDTQKTTEEEAMAKYSKRLSAAALANKTQKTTIERLKSQLDVQNESNKQITLKMERLLQLNKNRQGMLRCLKDDLFKTNRENADYCEKNKALTEEVDELKHSLSYVKSMLSVAHEEKYRTATNRTDREQELKQKVKLMQDEIDNLKNELTAKENKIEEFLKNTRESLGSELVKLSRTVDEGASRLRTAENKTTQLCKAITKLLKMFYQRRLARRLVTGYGDDVNTTKHDISLEPEKSSGGRQKGKSSSAILKEDSNYSLNAEETVNDVRKGLRSSSNPASLREVIDKFHILIHKSNFSEELGTFLFNNIVNPFLFK